MRKKVRYPSEEYRLVESLRPYCGRTHDSFYNVGIGDDAADRICTGGERLAFTADAAVENTHFRLDYMSLAEIGYKTMITNASDCAAMGAVPEAALVQAVIPHGADKPQASLKALYQGFDKACRQYRLGIIGGDLARGDIWTIAITMIGRLFNPARPLLRRGAMEGDGVWVTGRPGASGAGLAALRKWGRGKSDQRFRTLVRAHIAPQARVECARKLVDDGRVHAAMDISDGVAKECLTLAFDNELAIDLAIPDSLASPAMKRLAAELNGDWRDWTLNGGEDYELLFAAAESFDPAPLRCKGMPLFRIGSFKRGRGVFLHRPDGSVKEIRKGGWDHF